MALDKDNTIRVAKTFDAPVAELYDLCSDEDFFDFCGADLTSGEHQFRLGGRYSYVVDESDFMKGEFKEIVPNAKIAFTWFTMGLNGPTGETLVTMTFKEDNQGCHVELVHTGIKHRKTAKGHDEGWTEIFESIAESISDPVNDDHVTA